MANKGKKSGRHAALKPRRKRIDTKTDRSSFPGNRTKKRAGVRRDKLVGLAIKAKASAKFVGNLFGNPAIVPGKLWCSEGQHWVGKAAAIYPPESEEGGKPRPRCPVHPTCILLKRRPV